jgi:hypothetical protein
MVEGHGKHEKVDYKFLTRSVTHQARIKRVHINIKKSYFWHDGKTFGVLEIFLQQLLKLDEGHELIFVVTTKRWF